MGIHEDLWFCVCFRRNEILKNNFGGKKDTFFPKKKKKKKGTLPLVLFSYCFENLKKVNQ